jgi:hypothetical protein
MFGEGSSIVERTGKAKYRQETFHIRQVRRFGDDHIVDGLEDRASTS